MFVTQDGTNQVMVWHGWDGTDYKARYLYASSFDASDGKIEIYYG